MPEVELSQEEQQEVQKYATEKNVTFNLALQQIIKIGLDESLGHLAPSTMAVKRIALMSKKSC